LSSRQALFYVMDTSIARLPVIQRLGDMGKDGSVCHIGGHCYKRAETMEPITKAEFDRLVYGKHEQLVTWDPMEE
jgi:hypothetical protein